MSLVTWHNVPAVSSTLLEPQPLGTALPPDVVEHPTPRTPAQTPTDSAAAGELRHLLFDGNDRERVHAPWHTLVSAPSYRHRDGLTPAERASLAYERLREINTLVPDPRALARDPRLLASLHEWAAIVDGGGGLCTVAGIHYNLFLGSLLDHEDTGRRDLSDFTSMRRTGTFLCTELEHGNDAGALETTAEYDRDSDTFVLHTPTDGARKFMPNTSPLGGPKSALVAARLLIDNNDEGVFLFLTPLSDENGTLPGIRIHPLPLRPDAPVDHCLTAFDHVRLDRSALLEAEHGHLDTQGRLNSTLGNKRKRFLHSISRVTTGKLCMSAAAIGASRAALAIAVRYAQHRHISGPRPGERIPLQAHRSHHGRLLTSLATVYAMTFAHRETVNQWCTHHPAQREEAERQTAIMKAWNTWQARTITTECRERCGAQALFSANGLADFPQNTEGTITAEGDNLVIWLKAAGEILFHPTTHPPRSNHTPPAERPLTDLIFLRELLAQTEQLWRNRARTALRQGPTGNPLARWNTASDAALQMVAAHATLNAADAFLNTIKNAQHPTTRNLLQQLCRLFLLRQLTQHTGDLLADNHLTPQHVWALPDTINTATNQLAPHLHTLTHAFDLPTTHLNTLPMLNNTPPPTHA
ncbi:acyl-CoA dehydrogenase [Streptomyces sp. NBC_00859]|uniref:acyl-CoA dehydrogenase family protein n=1 Tax=Streptomyces sp. NBC_00859 TaxID=2903682 RepID=UPI00386A70C4|nr:acyl-CoA oxidase [Streptomyces sp. NBC_00859]